MKSKFIKSEIHLWLALLLAWTMSVALPAQTNSVVTLNADKALVINGQKVFPIGFSPGPPTNGKTPTGSDALQELRDAGALLTRMTQTTDWDSQLITNQQAVLDWAYQHGMFVWLNLRELSKFPAGDTNTPASLSNIVNTFKNHPALGLWKNFDEAWWGGVSVADLQRGYDLIKLVDTNHAVVQTHAPRGTVADLQPYNAATDVLALDIYPVTASGSASNPPITNTQVSQLGDWTQVLGQVANGQKEYWMIEQIAFSGTTPPAHPLVFPTFTQSRFMAYQAIHNGARGLMFFGGNIAATLNAQDAPLGWNWTFWNDVLKPLVRELGDRGPLAHALVAPASTLPITMSGTVAPDVEFCVREVPPCIYILASKREGATTNVTFSGLPAWATNADVLYESPRTITATNGQFTDSFAQWDVHVYRFSQTIQSPTIIFPPQNRTNGAGTTATFSVMADGTGPLAYQWRKNGTNLSSATTSVLMLTNVTLSDVAGYDVVVAGFGSVTSVPPATLVVENQPPVIISPPASRTNYVGTIATFSVTASGSGPLAYQWRRSGTNLSNGGNISGATSSSLTLASVTQTDAAPYQVVVTGAGSVTSAPPAMLTVISYPSNQLILYEPFDYLNIGAQVSSNTPANWAFNGSGANDLSVVNGSLAYSGLRPGLGNSVTNGGAGLGTRRLFGASFNGGQIYFSALFRINDLGFGTWNGASSQVGALTATDNQSFRLAIQVALSSSSGYVIGVQKGGTGAMATFDFTEHYAGETIFLAGKYDFTTSPNPVSLWINPDPSTFGAPSEPGTGFISATSGLDGFAIDRFNMRQNTAASVPASMQWDELRFGFSWADVTPIQPPLITPGSVTKLGNGAIQFAYTNGSSQSFSVLASTNLINWTAIGTATLISPGLYQFTDPTAPNFPRRFYQLRSP